MLALVAVAFCACSSDDVALTESAVTPAIGGDGYITLAINMPTTPAARAANDVYDDGLESEYTVNDATLLLFQGTSESTAVYLNQYDLTTDFELYEEKDDNITSRSIITTKIDGAEAGNNLYALVVLNKNSILTTSTFGGVTLEGAKFSDFQSTAVNLGGASQMTENGFYMTNAPLISTPGGTNIPTGTITTLAVIDPDKIYTTEAEAKNNPATEIYVERGMAKVTITDATASSTSAINATITGFALDLTNNVTYPVRSTLSYSTWLPYYNGSNYVAATDKYRFAGNVEVGANLYRTYWAVDPNYDTAPYTADSPEGARDYGQIMTSLAGQTFSDTGLGEDSPQYCLENTFNVAHQNEDETSRVIIKAILNDGNDFYTLDGVKSTLYTKETILAQILTAFSADGYVEAAQKLWVGGITNNLYDHVIIAFDDDATASDDLTFTITFDEDITADNFGGELPDVFNPGSEIYAQVVADLNEAHEISYYEGGVSYYPIKIKHFGDDLTYWNLEDVNGVSYPEDIYGQTAEANWLGRYGVLRNNWYEVQVTAINDIGSATVPTAYGEPDDPVEKWISININVLSWAKRVQSATL